MVYEGEPVRIEYITLSGAEDVIPNRELQRGVPLRVGEPFNRFLLRASADTIRASLRNRGHPHAEVYRNFDLDLDAEAREARVQFDVVPGARAIVGEILVSGTDRVEEAVVRKMLAIQPGQPFSQEALYESQRDLYRMDIFGYVHVVLDDSLPKDDGDSLVSIRVQVSEGALHQVRAGAGYGTNDCIRTLASWTARAFFGGGRSLEVNARTSKIGTGPPFDWGFQRNVCLGLRNEEDSEQGRERLKLNYNVSATMREPFFFSRRTQAAVSLFAERRSEVNAFLSDAVGGELSLSRRLFRDIPVTLSYTLSYGRTQAEPAIYCGFLNVCLAEDTVFSNRRVQSTLGLRAIWNRANSPLDPTRGFVMTLELSHASNLTGSDSLSQFNKGVFELSGTVRMTGYGDAIDFATNLIGEAGWVDALGTLTILDSRVGVRNLSARARRRARELGGLAPHYTAKRACIRLDRGRHDCRRDRRTAGSDRLVYGDGGCHRQCPRQAGGRRGFGASGQPWPLGPQSFRGSAGRDRPDPVQW